MKTPNTLLASALLALTISAPATVLAQPGHFPEKTFAVATYPASHAGKLWLCLEKYNPDAKITVELINPQGQVLHREGLPTKGGRRGGFRQQFDLSQVGDGTYTFRISDGAHTEAIAFNVSTPAVEPLPARLISLR